MRIASIGKGLHALLRKRRAESELDEELEAFVEAAVAEKLRCGMSVEQALGPVWLNCCNFDARPTFMRLWLAWLSSNEER